MVLSVAKVFPEAKLVMASAAIAKCMYVGCCPADYLYDTPDGIHSARKVLFACDISLHHIEGDVMTQSLFVRAHNHLLECDMLYDKFGVTDTNQWTRCCSNCSNDSFQSLHMCSYRCFYYTAIGKACYFYL